MSLSDEEGVSVGRPKVLEPGSSYVVRVSVSSSSFGVFRYWQRETSNCIYLTHFLRFSSPHSSERWLCLTLVAKA